MTLRRSPWLRPKHLPIHRLHRLHRSFQSRHPATHSRGRLRTRRVAHDAASCRARCCPCRSLHFRRRYLYVAESRPSLLRADLRWTGTRPAPRRTQTRPSVYWIFDAVRHFTVPEAERVFRRQPRCAPNFLQSSASDSAATNAAAAPSLSRDVCGRARCGSAPDQPRRRDHGA